VIPDSSKNCFTFTCMYTTPLLPQFVRRLAFLRQIFSRNYVYNVLKILKNL